MIHQSNNHKLRKSLRSCAEVPEHATKHECDDGRKEKSNSSILRVTPVGQSLLPQTSKALTKEIQRELSGEI